jgi:hypothetical protein
MEGIAPAASRVAQLRALLLERARATNGQCATLRVLEERLRSWVVGSARLDGRVAEEVGVAEAAEAAEAEEQEHEQEEAPDEAPPMSTALLRMDLELDRVLAKARRVRRMASKNGGGAGGAGGAGDAGGATVGWAKKDAASRLKKTAVKKAGRGGAGARGTTKSISRTSNGRVAKNGKSNKKSSKDAVRSTSEATTPVVPSVLAAMSPTLPRQDNSHVQTPNDSPPASKSTPSVLRRRAVALKLTRSETTKRARFLQKMHGQIDLAHIAAARDAYVFSERHVPTAAESIPACVIAPPPPPPPPPPPLPPHIEEETINLGLAHLENFLGALAQAEPVVPTTLAMAETPRIRAVGPVHAHNGHIFAQDFGMLRFGETMLDKYLFGVVAGPDSDLSIWQELRQVGHQQAIDMTLELERALSEIARAELLPGLAELCHDSALLDAGVDATIANGRLRDLLLLYRLADSLVTRRGLSFLRVVGRQ